MGMSVNSVGFCAYSAMQALGRNAHVRIVCARKERALPSRRAPTTGAQGQEPTEVCSEDTKKTVLVPDAAGPDAEGLASIPHEA